MNTVALAVKGAWVSCQQERISCRLLRFRRLYLVLYRISTLVTASLIPVEWYPSRPGAARKLGFPKAFSAEPTMIFAELRSEY